MPSSRVLFFADPRPYQTAVRAAEAEVFITTEGEPRAQLTQINLHRLWMQRGWETLPRVFHRAANAPRSPIVFLEDGKQGTIGQSGRELSSGAIIIDGVGATHDHRSFGPWASVSLTPEDLAEAGNVLNAREAPLPAAIHLIRPEPDLMARLLLLHESAARLAETAPNAPAQPEVAKSLERALIDAMIQCVASSSLEMRTAARRHAQIIARLEDLLAANRDRPLYLAEICATTGVSERTLRVCCHEHLGMGPVRYLWLRRMHLARAALIRADPASATVTSIATDHGFWELGRFSVEYRTLFGESPSVSLRGPPHDPRVTIKHPLASKIANLQSAPERACP
jgi:AraC-like DNA-binding protein